MGEQVDALGDVLLADDATVVDCSGGPKNEYQKESNDADGLFHISEIGRRRRRLSQGRLQPVTTFVTSHVRRGLTHFKTLGHRIAPSLRRGLQRLRISRTFVSMRRVLMREF